MDYSKSGFIVPIITEDHHILGSSGISLPIIKVDGDWTNYLPKFESQLESTFDSSGCAIYGTTNAIETLEKFLTGTENNYSDRALYNMVGVVPPGTDPHLVATTIRGQGLVDQIDLTDDCSSLAEFMTPRPVTVDLRVKGQKWLNKKMLGHQWLWDTVPNQATRLSLITEALTKGTVCVSVTAWYQDNHGLYYSPAGLSNCHWTHVYKIDSTGIYVFDSYITGGTYLKKLTLDHNIQFAKVYFETVPTQQQNWLVALITSFLELVRLKEKQQEIAVTAPLAVLPEVAYLQVKQSLMPNKVTISTWAKLIEKFEGANKSLNNPGNFKFSTLMASWGGQKAGEGSDGGYFCKFPTYDIGFKALCNFLTLGCEDELKDYHQARTIKQFTLVYTNHPKPEFDYSDELIKELGVTAGTNISTFLT